MHHKIIGDDSSVSRSGTCRLGAVLCALFSGGCSVDVSGVSFLSTPASISTAQRSTRALMLTAEGVCEGDASPDTSSFRARPAEVVIGIGECDLVRFKGKPTDVLIGDSGKGQRETQVLYSEPTGREIYLFTDNKLLKIVKPGQG